MLVMVYLSWGSVYLAMRFAVQTLPPFMMAAVRFALAGLLLYGWQMARGAPRPQPVHWRSAVVLAAFLILGSNGSVSWASQFIPSGLVALLTATASFWIVLFDWLAFGGPVPPARTIAGIGLGIAGVALLAGPGAVPAYSGLDWRAVGAVLGASVIWAIGSLYSRQAPFPDSRLTVTAMQMLMGSLLLAAVSGVTGEWGRLELAGVSTLSWLSLAYLVVVAITGFGGYLWLLTHVPPALATTYAYVTPVLAVLLGWLLGGEPLTWRIGLAAGLIVVSVGLLSIGPARPAQPSASPEADGARAL